MVVHVALPLPFPALDLELHLGWVLVADLARDLVLGELENGREQGLGDVAVHRLLLVPRKRILGLAAVVEELVLELVHEVVKGLHLGVLALVTLERKVNAVLGRRSLVPVLGRGLANAVVRGHPRRLEDELGAAKVEVAHLGGPVAHLLDLAVLDGRQVDFVRKKGAIGGGGGLGGSGGCDGGHRWLKESGRVGEVGWKVVWWFVV